MAQPKSDLEMESECPNCGASLQGQYCFQCGQNQKYIDRHFWSLVSEFLDEVFAPNSRAANTLYTLSFKPGFLSREYFSGRRARYIQPVRLYLTTSIVFFFWISISSHSQIDNPEGSGTTIEIAETDEFSVDGEWSILTAEESEQLNQQINQQVNKALTLIREDPNAAMDLVIEFAPPVIFCLVPLFALFLKLIYFNKGRYYTEHLVFALNNHSFLFLALLIESLIEHLPVSQLRDWLAVPLDLWIPIYFFLSLKLTFNDGYFSTTAKFLVLGVTYWVSFLLISFIAVMVGVMTL